MNALWSGNEVEIENIENFPSAFQKHIPSRKEEKRRLYFPIVKLNYNVSKLKSSFEKVLIEIETKRKNIK